MSDNPQWSAAPAMGSVIARMVELYVRALRVDLERRRQSIERMAKLVRK